MAGEVARRGPDGVGLYMDQSFGMVNTRLSIVDIAGGDQPLCNEDKQLWVMQNGEIYNAPELTLELERLGHCFVTRCDTEVLAHAYEEWGVDSLTRLNGAFAFAIWDRRKKELFLARDRLGIRPLFIAQYGHDFVFASECKSILRHPNAIRDIDPLGLQETFSLWAMSPDHTAFSGIRELAPGHYMRIDANGIVEQACWWDIPFTGSNHMRQESEQDLADELAELLYSSTQFRLRADVPVAAYLSGGLDSSLIAAIVQRISDKPLSSFAVRFADPLFDERKYQEQMARQLNTDLCSIDVQGSEIVKIFPEVIWLSEKPLLRTSPAPLLLLSREVQRHGLKVVLTGEGADEILGGYNIFREAKVRRFWAKQPESAIRPLLLRRLYPYLAQNLGRAEAFTKVFFCNQLTEVNDPLYSHHIRFRNSSRLQNLLQEPLRNKIAGQNSPQEQLLQRLPKEFDSFSPLSKAQYLEIKTFMQGYLLHSQGDRMLMGNSVEGRFPFLDHRVVEFAARLPDRLRIRGLQEKYLLRKAASPLLPNNIARREKRPYRAPILKSFIGLKSADYVRELTTKQALEKAGIFDSQMTHSLFTKCSNNIDKGVSETDEMALVAVISTMLLHQIFVDQPRLSPTAEATKVVIGDKQLLPT
jgi:asparagine synthase (glutamine-hydrolysing)